MKNRLIFYFSLSVSAVCFFLLGYLSKVFIEGDSLKNDETEESFLLLERSMSQTLLNAFGKNDKQKAESYMKTFNTLGLNFNSIFIFNDEMSVDLLLAEGDSLCYIGKFDFPQTHIRNFKCSLNDSDCDVAEKEIRKMIEKFNKAFYKENLKNSNYYFYDNDILLYLEYDTYFSMFRHRLFSLKDKEITMDLLSETYVLKLKYYLQEYLTDKKISKLKIKITIPGFSPIPPPNS